MAALNCVCSKDNGRENSQPHTEQPPEKTVLPPFSGKLHIDEKLKLSRVDFKQTINCFFRDRYITPLSQLTATPAFPTPYVLAQFASIAYTDYKRRETDAQYETRLDLPDGWKLLTTASNTGRNNGYFGAAYWQPKHQHVVIAHRGTDPNKWGPVWTDIQGVLRNKYVRQMDSASTFAYKVVEVLREVDHEKGTNFQVLFTGHSLGGWLAQITTFTTEYLKAEENNFLKSDNVPHSYHPHTVVFDSPGCNEMLSQMADTHDVLYDGRSIDLEHLDITSYLSAPNRINTCNKHVGTKYRVFTDLSDMGWWEAHTALYNLATHSRHKIVDVFDPKTGQVYRDENGQFKLQVIIDWPLSAGVSGGKEYKRFFKWAKHLNNYHAKVTEVSYPLKGYLPIRYQAKNYDERVTSISIFSQEELQFLEDYRRLCHLPEFFKPKEMFTAIGNKEIQEEAEEKLHSFEIQEKTIRCTNVSALQAHIPYVKRLLQLFPQIKENTKCALSPHENRNNVYQIGTKHYLEKLQQNTLHFKPDALSLRDFLKSDKQKVLHLRMVDGDAWTGLIKVYQMLQKTPSKTDFLSEGHYTVLTLQHLLLVNPMMNLNTLMESTTTPHLLMMACETDQQSNAETKQIFNSLYHILKQTQSVKIVLITQSKDDFTFLQDVAKETLNNGFVTRDELLIYSDLIQSSQEEILENLVNFQGIEIALNQLISPELPVTDLLPLADLLEERHLQIGKDPEAYSKCHFYDERYYIHRIFHHQVIIKQEVWNDNREQKFPDLLANTKQEFIKLCQLYPTRSVHWLERDKSGKLVWQQTQGSLEALRKYIDTDSFHTYTADDLDKLLEQARKHRVMLISDTAGMGKSTVLTHLSKQIKQKFPAKWVVRIDLNDHTDALEALQQEQIDKEKAIEFVSEELLELKPGLEMELFKQCCEQKQKVNIVIMLDGFDEVSPSYKETVIALLQALRQTAVEQLWVTTRPHLRHELVDKLQQLSYTLKPLSEENQVEILTKFWSLKDWFTEMDSEEKEEMKVKLASYAKHLIKKLAQSISDKDKEYTGIPLNCRMLAEAFDEEVKTFCQSAESVPELPFSLDLIGLYETFIENKYNIYQTEKSKTSLSDVAAKIRQERELQNMRQYHQLLALKMLFNEEQVAMLQSNTQCILSDEEIIMIGIVQVSDDGKLHFIHRTFAEYYVAKFVVYQFTNGSNISQQVQDLILQNIFLKEDYRVIRIFINALFSRSQPPKEVLNQYASRIHDLCRDGVLTLHQAAREGNVHIIGFLLDSLQAGGHTDIVHELLLAQDEQKRTAWKLAAMGGHIDVLEMLWQCATEKLTNAELVNKVLLAEDNLETPIWHYASYQGNVQVLQKLWVCCRQTLTADELNNKLVLAKDKMERTAWHLAAEKGNLEVLQKVWEWAEMVLTTEELNNKFFFAKDNMGRTAWHYASLLGNIEAMQKMWEWGKAIVTAQELNNKLLLAKDNEEDTAWHLAAKKGKVEVLQKLWECGKETLTAEQLNSKLLLDKDYSKRTACHYVSWRGNIEALQKLWEWGKETLTAEELYNKLLSAKDNSEQTAWHLAAENGNIEVLQKLWVWGKETLTEQELNSNLLLAKDKMERTAWHYATLRGNVEALQKLCEWGKETLTAEELSNKLVLAKDKMEQTAWHLAAEKGNLKVLQNLWVWAKDRLTRQELNNKLLLAKDKMERTAWHLAAEKGNIELLQKVWEWAEEVLTKEELKNKFLFAKDNMGRKAWHYASLLSDVEALQKMWEWGKANVTAQELNNKLLLAKDKEEDTAWHLAAKKDNVEVLQKLWECGKETLTAEELKNRLLLAKDKLEGTAWHAAAEEGNVEALKKLWELGKKTLTEEELKNKLLLAKNKMERTAWHYASLRGKVEALHKLLDWGIETLTTEELCSKLLLAKDKMERTAWHYAS